jgi:hypothetical protein
MEKKTKMETTMEYMEKNETVQYAPIVDCEFKISGDLWKKSIGAISNIIDNGHLILSEHEITIKAMDPSNISMVEYRLPYIA